MVEYPEFLTGTLEGKVNNYNPDDRILLKDIYYNPSEKDPLIWELNGTIEKAVEEQEFWYDSYKTHASNVRIHKLGTVFLAFYEPIKALDDIISLYTGWKAIGKALGKTAGKKVAEAALSNVGLLLEKTGEVVTVGTAIQGVYDTLKNAFNGKSPDTVLEALSEGEELLKKIGDAVSVFVKSDVLSGVLGYTGILEKIVNYKETLDALTLKQTREFYKLMKDAEVPYEIAAGNFYYYTALAKQLSYLKGEYQDKDITTEDVMAQLKNVVKVDKVEYSGQLRRMSPNLYAILEPSVANASETLSSGSSQKVPVFWREEKVGSFQIAKPSNNAGGKPVGPPGADDGGKLITKEFRVLLTGEDQVLSTNKSSTIDGNVVNLGTFNNQAGHTTALAGSVFTNDGTITVNDGKSGYSASLVADSDLKLTGIGEVQLNHGYGTWGAQLNTTDKGTITNDTKHTISGRGEINAELINKGTINANIKGSILYLKGADKTNLGVLTASKGGILAISGIELDNTKGKIKPGTGSIWIGDNAILNNQGNTLTADGGDISLVSGGKIIGGVLDSKGKSAIIGAGGIIEDVTNKGLLRVPPSSATTVAGKTLTNNGTIAVNDGKSGRSAYLVADSDLKLTGKGEVQLNHGYGTWGAQLNTTDKGTITNDSKHTISGRGEINAELINKGTIDANIKGSILYLKGADKTNLGVLTASKGGILAISGIELDNTKGKIKPGTGSIWIGDNAILNNQGNTLTADGGDISLVSGGKIIGGVLDSKGKSAIIGAGGIIEGVTNKGLLRVPSSSTTTVAGKTLTNNGIIAVSDGKSGRSAYLVADSDLKLTGIGEVQLKSYGSLNTTDKGTITNDSKHTISGNGQINAPLANKGTIAPGLGIGTLYLNNNYQQLKTGVLNIELGTQGSDQLKISGTATLGGTLDIDIAGNFAPKPGDTFTILTAGQIKGKFDKIKDATTKNGITLKPQITDTGLILTATGKSGKSNRSNPQTRSNPTGNSDIEDTLIGGGSGEDILPSKETDDVLTNTADSNSSQTGIENAIADFIAGNADKIYLSGTQFPKLDPEIDFAEQFAAVGSDKAAATSDAYIVYNSNNGNLFYNANGDKPGFGSGGQLAIVDGVPELDASDFVV